MWERLGATESMSYLGAVVESFSCVQLFFNTVDCSPPGSFDHGISQAERLEWVAISSSRGIFLTQGLNLYPLHCRQVLYH